MTGLLGIGQWNWGGAGSKEWGDSEVWASGRLNGIVAMQGMGRGWMIGLLGIG